MKRQEKTMCSLLRSKKQRSPRSRVEQLLRQATEQQQQSALQLAAEAKQAVGNAEHRCGTPQR
jgi:hypothetical protein